MNELEERLLESGAVLLVPEGPAELTEYGKRYFDERMTVVDRHIDLLPDILEEAERQLMCWTELDDLLRREAQPADRGVLTAVISSGVSQYGMQGLVNYINANGTAMTRPATVALCLGTTAPSSTTTGVNFAETTYTGYTRMNITASIGAATAATPSVATNTATITFPYTSGTATLQGFICADTTTLASGNSLWWGTLAAVSISSTQQPPTVANGALSLSMTGT